MTIGQIGGFNPYWTSNLTPNDKKDDVEITYDITIPRGRNSHKSMSVILFPALIYHNALYCYHQLGLLCPMAMKPPADVYGTSVAESNIVTRYHNLYYKKYIYVQN